MLNQLERARLPVEHVSIHTPDLDDVFFAVTGHPNTGHSNTGHPNTEEATLT
jgi:ABC-2 type transport system ATP-binding protein